jgi:hypothetical protein
MIERALPLQRSRIYISECAPEVSQLMIEMCRREVSNRQLAQFDFRAWRQILRHRKVHHRRQPVTGRRGAELRAADSEGRVSMTATAKFS